MLSLSAAVRATETVAVEGPRPEDVMRHYLRERVKVLQRERAAELMGTTAKNVDHIKDGRRGIEMEDLAAVSGERTTSDLFGALAELSKQAQRGEIVIATPKSKLQVLTPAAARALVRKKKTGSR